MFNVHFTSVTDPSYNSGQNTPSAHLASANWDDVSDVDHLTCANKLVPVPSVSVNAPSFIPTHFQPQHTAVSPYIHVVYPCMYPSPPPMSFSPSPTMFPSGIPIPQLIVSANGQASAQANIACISPVV